MAEYIDIDAPIDVALYHRNKRAQITIRQILESNDAKYKCSDVIELKHGKWEKHEDKTFVYWLCSECGHDAWYEEDLLGNYCPYCGAEMEAEDA